MDINATDECYVMESGQEVRVKSSEVHVEFDPTPYGLRDRVVLQWIIEKTRMGPVKKTLIIHQAEKLTREAQFSVRRAMETGTWRYIFITENSSALMEPLRSRCLDIRNEVPTLEEVRGFIQMVCKRESMLATPAVVDGIILNCQCNMRMVLMNLASYRISGKVSTVNWKKKCEWIVNEMVCAQEHDMITPVIRDSIIYFINLGIPPEDVMREVYRVCMLSNIDDLYKIGIIDTASYFVCE